MAVNPNQGSGAWTLNEWTEVYRLAFAGLSNLTGGTSDAGTMDIGGVTWTLRNTGGAYLDSLNIASGKLVWDLNATSSSHTLETAATGPLLRTLLNNLMATIAAAQVTGATPIRFACAVTDLGDENTETIGHGIMGNNTATGRGMTMETGFIGGAATTQWSTYSPSKITSSGASVAATKTAMLIEMHGAHFIAYHGSAVSAEPPPLNDDAGWTVGVGCSMTAYAANQNLDFDFSSTAVQAVLHASNGNTNNNFAPSHTGIALAYARNFVLV